LPPQLVALLRTHRVEQQQERAAARQLWHDEGWAFASPTGQPINPRTDYNQWKRLLKEAGLREARLHDARHTAATVLLVLRQSTPTVMSLMGWSSESMAARYQHVTDALRSEVASQVGELIWDTAAKRRPGPGHGPPQLARHRRCRRRGLHRESPPRPRGRRGAGRTRRTPRHAAARTGSPRNSK
jgi:integrase